MALGTAILILVALGYSGVAKAEDWSPSNAGEQSAVFDVTPLATTELDQESGAGIDGGSPIILGAEQGVAVILWDEFRKTKSRLSMSYAEGQASILSSSVSGQLQ